MKPARKVLDLSSQSAPGGTVTVVGAGVAGLTVAVELAEAGIPVEVLERGACIGDAACSWKAGGMLAPWCEAESAEPEVVGYGQAGLAWWPRHIGHVEQCGTLVVAPARDTVDLQRFSRRTENFRWVNRDEISALEPDLGERFSTGLFFSEEAHLDPRAAMRALSERLKSLGVKLQFGVEADPALIAGVVVDCRGFAARGATSGLRGVRGEMMMLESHEIRLSRPVRMLHPRIPFYVVPRGDGRFMLGATMIESADGGAITARSAMELLNAAYALHPAFGEARIIEMAADVRPAYADNFPRLGQDGLVISINGMHRHGFLLSPHFAVEARRRIEAMRESKACI